MPAISTTSIAALRCSFTSRSVPMLPGPTTAALTGMSFPLGRDAASVSAGRKRRADRVVEAERRVVDPGGRRREHEHLLAQAVHERAHEGCVHGRHELAGACKTGRVLVD